MEEILNIIKNCCIIISDLIKNTDSNKLGIIQNEYNISGDNVKKLDLVSNDILIDNLFKCPYVRAIGSEEIDYLLPTQYKKADYLVCFDPLDGSSNIDVNITTGTIFAIYKYNVDGKIINGRNIVTAGYCLYGGSTQLIIADNVVKMYQLNNNTFELINDNIRIKEKGNIYSINESNKNIWLDKRFSSITDKFINESYTSRWVGSLVADAHRTILKGGFFAYPCNKLNKKGKIRLLYEAMPFAYIFEIAGGYSSNGEISILDIDYPIDCHEKTSIILASKYEMEIFLCYKNT